MNDKARRGGGPCCVRRSERPLHAGALERSRTISAVVVQLLRSRELGWLADSVVSFGFPFSLNIELLAVALGS